MAPAADIAAMATATEQADAAVADAYVASGRMTPDPESDIDYEPVPCKRCGSLDGNTRSFFELVDGSIVCSLCHSDDIDGESVSFY